MVSKRQVYSKNADLRHFEPAVKIYFSTLHRSYIGSPFANTRFLQSLPHKAQGMVTNAGDIRSTCRLSKPRSCFVLEFPREGQQARFLTEKLTYTLPHIHQTDGCLYHCACAVHAGPLRNNQQHLTSRPFWYVSARPDSIPKPVSTVAHTWVRMRFIWPRIQVPDRILCTYYRRNAFAVSAWSSNLTLPFCSSI